MYPVGIRTFNDGVTCDPSLNFINDTDDRVLVVILSFITLNELLIIGVVSKRLSKLSQTESLWEQNLSSIQATTLLDGAQGNFRIRSQSLMKFAGEKALEITTTFQTPETGGQDSDTDRTTSRQKYLQALSTLQHKVNNRDMESNKKRHDVQRHVLRTRRMRIIMAGLLLNIPCILFFFIVLSSRADDVINWPWYYVLIPLPIIYCNMLVFQLAALIKFQNPDETVAQRLCTLAGHYIYSFSTVIFTIFLTCKQAGALEWSYLLVFIPLILKYVGLIFFRILHTFLLLFRSTFTCCKPIATLLDINNFEDKKLNTINNIQSIVDFTATLIIVIFMAQKLDRILDWSWLTIFSPGLISIANGIVRALRDAEIQNQELPLFACCMFTCMTACFAGYILLLFMLPLAHLDGQLSNSWANTFTPMWILLACFICYPGSYMCWLVISGRNLPPGF